MGGIALPVIAGIGTLGGLLQGSQANRTARSQLGLQQEQAQREAQLFGTTSPYYSQVLAALGGLAGLNSGIPSLAGVTPGAGFAGGNFSGAPALPYSNVTAGQLGPFANNPGDAFRLRAAEDEARQATRSALDNFSFGQGQRGLFGSSIDAAGRAAISEDAAKNLAGFGRQLAIQAPQAAMERLSTLGGLLNPGLGAGPTAGNLFGQTAGAYGALGQGYGQQAAGAIGNYLQFQNLQNHMAQFQQPGTFAVTQPIAQGPMNQMADLADAIP